MLTGVYFKNYKAFVEGKIEIKPITLLLGANSVGKSSLLQLLLMLQQTTFSDKNYKSALSLYGGYVSLGEGKNLFRKKDDKKNLTISIEFSSSELAVLLKEKLLNQYCQEFIYFSSILDKNLYTEKEDGVITNFLRTIGLISSKPSRKGSEFDIRMMLHERSVKKLDKETFYSLINKVISVFPEKKIQEAPDDITDSWFFMRMRTDFNFLNLPNRKEEYLLTYDVLNYLSEAIKSNKFEVKYEISHRDQILHINKLSIMHESKELFTFEFDEASGFKLTGLKSEFIDISRKESHKSIPISDLRKLFESPRTIFNILNTSIDFENRQNFVGDKFSVFSYTMFQILNQSLNIAKNNFREQKINYVSPLRAHPKRYYFLDKARVNSYVDTLDGDSLAETLKENNYLKDQVNAWLSKFNLKVSVSQLEDIIHRISINQNTLELDITDVGFGISQILPVIIQGFVSPNQSITLIEQPEIHIHPKMQADLADLFIDIVQKKDKNDVVTINKYLLIETHSEYLLKRLRRRISEGVISPENVAIYLISQPMKGSEGSIIEKLDIKEKGFFEWPHDYYGGELTKDITEFIKNQHQ